MGPCQNVLTQVGSGQIFVAQVGSGQVSHLWFEYRIGKFPLKMSNFSIFCPSGQTKCHRVGSKSAHVRAGSASYLLRVKSMSGSGQGPSLVTCDISITPGWHSIHQGSNIYVERVFRGKLSYPESQSFWLLSHPLIISETKGYHKNGVFLPFDNLCKSITTCEQTEEDKKIVNEETPILKALGLFTHRFVQDCFKIIFSESSINMLFYFSLICCPTDPLLCLGAFLYCQIL